jgi:hypothetical protein
VSLVVVRLVAVVSLVFGVVAAAGCEDPCVTLATRICNCELTSAERTNCQTERIVNEQSSIKITDADRDVCVAKLQTCTCDALDNNDLDKCGFVPE